MTTVKEEESELENFLNSLPEISDSRVQEIITVYQLDSTNIKSEKEEEEEEEVVENQKEDEEMETEDDRKEDIVETNNEDSKEDLEEDISTLIQIAEEIIRSHERNRTSYRRKSCPPSVSDVSEENNDQSSGRGRRRLYSITERKWQKWRNNYVFYLKKQIEKELLNANLILEESRNKKLKYQYISLEMELQRAKNSR